MPLGWIDFSKSERSKVLSVLDLLSENSTLDELGIAPIRDGFGYAEPRNMVIGNTIWNMRSSGNCG